MVASCVVKRANRPIAQTACSEVLVKCMELDNVETLVVFNACVCSEDYAVNYLPSWHAPCMIGTLRGGLRMTR
jgi:hypothetical protein